MSLINPSLLFALPLAVIPILLHLLLRSKPKRMIFPALQLIQSRRKSNVSKMRLKQFWLMLLRVLVIAVIVAAIARPSFPAANYQPNWYEMIMTGLIGLAACIAYKFIVRRWKNQSMAHHILSYKRTWLRSVIIFIGFATFLLAVLLPYGYRLRAELMNPQSLVTENIPTATVMIFDSSLSMEYRQQSKTRLDVAREIAAEHMDQFPSGSRVAVIDNSDRSPVLFQIDQPTAKKRMFDMQLSPRTVPLNVRILDALSYQNSDRERLTSTQGEAGGDRFVREVYIFTDLSKTAWDLTGDEYLRSELEMNEYLQVYLIDVGKDDPSNFMLSNLQFESETVLEGQPVELQVSAKSERERGVTHQLELYINNENGVPVKRSSEDVLFDSDGPVMVPLSFDVNTESAVQGEVRLTSNDAMTFDDVRYFTVERKPTPQVLIVTDDPRDSGSVWRDMLSPEGEEYFFKCEMATPDEMVRSRIDQFENICLINVERPSEEFWDKIQQYVTQGGGLFVILGNSRIDQVAYNTEAGLSVMPAEVLGRVPMKPAETIDFKAGENHALLAPVIQKYGDLGDLRGALVDRCWSVKPSSNSSVVVSYTSPLGYPAMLERIVGRGRVILLTTAVDYASQWSELARADWMVVLADRIMQYTAGGSTVRLNYSASEGVILPLDSEQKLNEILLRLPDLKQLRETYDSDKGLVYLRNTSSLGHYQLLSAGPPVKPLSYFSVNISDEESNMQKMTTEELDSFFGAERYQVATSTEELERQVGLGRVGQEMFPLIIALLLAIFWGEHLVANRFYEQEQQLPVVR